MIVALAFSDEPLRGAFDTLFYRPRDAGSTRGTQAVASLTSRTSIRHCPARSSSGRRPTRSSPSAPMRRRGITGRRLALDPSSRVHGTGREVSGTRDAAWEPLMPSTTHTQRDAVACPGGSLSMCLSAFPQEAVGIGWRCKPAGDGPVESLDDASPIVGRRLRERLFLVRS